MKALSVLMSYIIYIGIAMLVISIVLPSSFKILNNIKDSNSIENAKKILIELDSAIKSAALNQGYNEVRVNFERGEIRYFEDNNEIAYLLKTDFPGIGAQSLQRIGILTISGNQDVDNYITQVKGRDCYALENSYIFLCILKVENKSISELSALVLSFKNKILQKEFPANFSIFLEVEQNLTTSAELLKNVARSEVKIDPLNLKIILYGFSDLFVVDFGDYKSKISLKIPDNYEIDISGFINPESGVYTPRAPYVIFYKEKELLGVFGYRGLNKIEYDRNLKVVNMSFDELGTALFIFSSGNKNNFLGKMDLITSGKFLTEVNPNFFERIRSEKEISVSIKYDPARINITDFGKISPGNRIISVRSTSRNPAIITIDKK
jgi:hypothetical protein